MGQIYVLVFTNPNPQGLTLFFCSNPVEYLWAYWKQHEMANFCPKDIWQLSHAASQALKRIRRRRSRPQLITAFFHQAELF